MADLVCGTSTGSEIADAINDNTNGKAPVGHRHDGTEVDVSVEGTSYVLNDALELFVLEEAGKDLSDNNFTDEYLLQIGTNKTDIAALSQEIGELVTAEGSIESNVVQALTGGVAVDLSFTVVNPSTEPTIFSFDDVNEHINLLVPSSFSVVSSYTFEASEDVNTTVTLQYRDVSDDSILATQILTVVLLTGETASQDVNSLIVVSAGEAPLEAKISMTSSAAGLSVKSYYSLFGSTGRSVVAGVGRYIGTNIAIANDDTALQMVSGDDNVALGRDSQTATTGGNNNLSLLRAAGKYISTGSHNIALGFESLLARIAQPITGNDNIALGRTTGAVLTSGSNNVLLGRAIASKVDSAEEFTGSSNVIIGNSAGTRITSGLQNILVGTSAGNSSSPIGGFSYYVTGADNIALGTQAASYLTSGSFNVTVGSSSGKRLTTGQHNVFLGTETGHGGALIGQETSGSNNIAIGYRAGYNLTSGERNVLLGHRAGEALTNADEKLHIANNQTESLIEGDFAARTVHINGELTVETLAFVDVTVSGTLTAGYIFASNKITTGWLEATSVEAETLAVENSIILNGSPVHANPKVFTIQDIDSEPTTGMIDGDVLYIWTD